MKKTKITLGWLVKDKVTGFQGIAIARLSHLTGCDQIGVAPKIAEGKTSDYPDTLYIDEMRLVKIGEGILGKEVKNKKDPGGPVRVLNSTIRFR